MPVAKHGGGSIMLQGCFAGKAIDTLQKIHGIMRKEDYIEHVKISARKVQLGCKWTVILSIPPKS